MNSGMHFSTPHATVRNGGPASGYAPAKPPPTCRRVVAYWSESPSRTSCARGQCDHMSDLPLLRRWFMDIRSHRNIGHRLCARSRILDGKHRGIGRRGTHVLGACRNGVPTVHRAGSMRAILHSRLYNRCPIGLSGARHITLAAGGGRPSSRLASRAGSLWRNCPHGRNGSLPAGGASRPHRSRPRIAHAAPLARPRRQRVVHRLRTCTVSAYPQPRRRVRDHGRRLHRLLRGSALVSRGHSAGTRWALDACKQHNRAVRTHAANAWLLGNHRARRANPLRADAMIAIG